MKNALYIDFAESKIIMTSTFAKKCTNTSSNEYRQLQSVRRDYPEFLVVTRQIKKNPNMEHYKGLTYDYMESYIRNHTPIKEVDQVLDEFYQKIEISKCHSVAHRYPTIKKWFLSKYPEVADFIKEKNAEESTETALSEVKAVA